MEFWFAAWCVEGFGSTLCILLQLRLGGLGVCGTCQWLAPETDLGERLLHSMAEDEKSVKT